MKRAKGAATLNLCLSFLSRLAAALRSCRGRGWGTGVWIEFRVGIELWVTRAAVSVCNAVTTGVKVIRFRVIIGVKVRVRVIVEARVFVGLWDSSVVISAWIRVGVWVKTRCASFLFLLPDPVLTKA